MPRHPTLESVAARAGVSRATAGRVLSGMSVKDANREAVQQAAAELGYVTNYAARALMTGRSGSVAFVMSADEMFSDPFFATILRGVHQGVAARQRQLMFIIASVADERRRLEQYVAGGHLDGVMIGALHGPDPLPDEIRRLGVPVVQCGRPHQPDPEQPFVDADNEGGAAQAARYLLERRTSVVMVAGPSDMTPAQDRLSGFARELERAGVPLAGRVAHESFTIEGGRAAMNILLDRVPDLDGVFAASDAMALGAIQALTERGRRVPDDVGVVGFDDVPLAAAARPPLTTVRQPVIEMGRTLAEQLLDLVDGTGEARRVLLPTELVVRDSA
ncbi:LacI family DNA-binding transcriptional regulator [Desertihabitans aurantiacus]|uniref:LacI family DNA-binding transcriptional regulator n=1 Tax=Desertihabitans aurantiacus TaxID=2282477 RepID=UPI001E35BDDC|nr:LacI family DNA-binding transcriptional regulator [Desertihabitans aurantiacus]